MQSLKNNERFIDLHTSRTLKAQSLSSTILVATTICGFGFLNRRRTLGDRDRVGDDSSSIPEPPSDVPMCALHSSFADINVAGSRGIRGGLNRVELRRLDFRSAIRASLAPVLFSLSTSCHFLLRQTSSRDDRFGFAVTGDNFLPLVSPASSVEGYFELCESLRDWKCCIRELKSCFTFRWVYIFQICAFSTIVAFPFLAVCNIEIFCIYGILIVLMYIETKEDIYDRSGWY